MKITLSLKESDITQTIQRLKEAQVRIRKASDLFVERLADAGIEVARGNSKEYGAFIVFSKYVSLYGKDDHVAIMYAQKTTDLVRKWWKNGELVSVEIDPLLMEEFGSGFKAYVPKDLKYADSNLLSNVGQGTFPGQTHADDPDGWSWTDENGVYHHSFGEGPGQPMYNAREAMYQQIYRIAREVFRNVV